MRFLTYNHTFSRDGGKILMGHPVRYYKLKYGLQKTYFLPFISVFTLINSVLIFISSDRVTAFLLIIKELRGHWSLVTCTFTLIQGHNNLVSRLRLAILNISTLCSTNSLDSFYCAEFFDKGCEALCVVY